MKHRSLDPILLLGAITIFAATLTWVLPAGSFDRARDPQTGRTLVVPGSYQRVPGNPVGPWGVLTAIPQGLIEAAEVVFFVLLAGGALTVVEGTGAIANFLNHTVARFAHRPLIVLALSSMLFLLGGATNNMYEEILAFIPLLCVLMGRLGLPNEMALGVSVGMSSVAAVFSPANAFTLGISQPLAELRLFSGFVFRTVMFVLALAIWCGYLAWYATRLGCRPSEHDGEQGQPGKWKPRDIAVLAALNIAMALLVIGGVFWHWELRQFSAIFVLLGVSAGLAGGLGWRGTSERFAEGLQRMILGAALVGLARAISVVLSTGMILDTISNALFSPLRHLPLSLSAVTMLVSESILAFPMPSDSGRAVMSLPVVVPLADLLGLSRQMVVVAYQYSGIVSSLVTPTAGALLAMLALSKVSFAQWLRFISVPCLLLFILAALGMIAGVGLGVE
jgi:uncharacterized ion transporter superfamily protein YfcC